MAPPLACHVHLQVRQNTNKEPEFPTLLQPAIPTSMDTKPPFWILPRDSLPFPQVPKITSLLVLPLFRPHIGSHRHLKFPISELPHPLGGI